jgi:hypothetical protein
MGWVGRIARMEEMRNSKFWTQNFYARRWISGSQGFDDEWDVTPHSLVAVELLSDYRALHPGA